MSLSPSSEEMLRGVEAGIEDLRRAGLVETARKVSDRLDLLRAQLELEEYTDEEVADAVEALRRGL